MAQSVQEGGTRDRRHLVSRARIIEATSTKDLSSQKVDANSRGLHKYTGEERIKDYGTREDR